LANTLQVNTKNKGSQVVATAADTMAQDLLAGNEDPKYIKYDK
jgi:hypothetical protein